MADSNEIGAMYVRVTLDKSDYERGYKDIIAMGNSFNDRYGQLKATIDTNAAKMKLSELQNKAKDLQAEFNKQKKLNADFGTLEKLKTELDYTKQKIKSVHDEAGKKIDADSGFMGRLTSLATRLGLGLAAITGVKKVIEVTKSFQDLQARLESMYMSVEKAEQVFGVFKKIAATTPYSLRQVAEAGTTLKAFGLNAEETIKPVADLAAFMGVPIQEAASSWGRAFAGGVGAADIFRERGVLTLIKSFKGIDDLTKMTLPEFRKAMDETFTDRTAGISGAV